MNLSKYCISENYNIVEAIAAIENCKERNILVLNESSKLVGVLSQGDILKAILKGIDMYANVTQIYSKSFIYLNERNIAKAIKIVKNKNINLIPVIDDNFEIIDVITINDILIHLER